MDNTMLKTIKIEKEKLKYFFIGGMVYNTKFSFDTGSHNEYPFTTYYINRIMDKKEDGIRYKSLIYCKLPLICLQFEKYCKCIEFDLPASCNGKSVIPFVGLCETADSYDIIFKHFPESVFKEKKNAWLGFSNKRKLKTPSGKVDFKLKIYTKKSWKEAVSDFFKKHKLKKQKIYTRELMIKIKEALFRSYDNEMGTFIQMPWTNSTGFCMDKYSYSLLGFEAKSLNYFQELYEITGDPDYKIWVKRLEKLFLNPKMSTETKNGFVWYNMTHFNGNKLKGLFYLDIGYAGYPPDQATISLNLCQYLKRNESLELKKLVRKNIEYILRTQNKDGSWTAAISYGRIKNRKWKKSEGSTAECVRGLLAGYQIFKEKKYLESAKNGLVYLDRKNIICRNVLRDIGIDEPEAFSSIIAVETFLDAYDIFKEKKYIELAKNYAYNMLTFHYWHGKLKGYFHPITESITPRISPFESAMAVKAYKRLYKQTKEKIWNEISDYLFNLTLKVMDNNNAFSEGIFPKFDGKLHYLPMEQTFATTELLHSCLLYGFYRHKKLKKERIKIDEKEEYFILDDKIKIKKKEFGITVGEKEFNIFLSKPYQISSRIYTKISNFFRRLGLINVIRDIKYLFTGVKPSSSKVEIFSIKRHIKEYFLCKGKNEILIKISLPYHDVQISLFKSGKIKMKLFIFVKKHDLVCNKVIINNMDYTLSTNWTEGGLFKKTIELE